MPTYGPHDFGAVDDCIRCIHCEALVGTPGPCTANPVPDNVHVLSRPPEPVETGIDITSGPLKVERDLVQEVLDQHFGIYYGSQGVSLCATCDKVSWPCPPALLAKQVRDDAASAAVAMETQTKARRSDPSTSVDAASLIKAKSHTQRIRLLRAFRFAGPAGLTDEQAAIHAGIDLASEYATRCSELRRANVIAFNGATRSTSHGPNRMVSAITQIGREVMANRDARGL